MSAMTTSLTEFSDSTDSRTYVFTGHTVAEPRMVIQKRKVPANVDATAESSIRVIYGTLDPDGVPLAQKVSFEVIVRYPVKGESADVTSALATFRDIIAGDEFGVTVSTQKYLK